MGLNNPSWLVGWKSKEFVAKEALLLLKRLDGICEMGSKPVKDLFWE
jgi:hypothetical protein